MTPTISEVLGEMKSALDAYRDGKSAMRLPHVELALYHMLRHYQDDLPDLDDDSGFHKAFRQRDILPSGDLDMVVWHLLAQSDLFWQILESYDVT